MRIERTPYPSGGVDDFIIADPVVGHDAMPSKRVMQEFDRLGALWVAMTEGEIVAKGEDAAQVLRQTKRKTRQEVTLFKVPRREEEAHVL